jgi:hypothetical protein
MNTYAGTFNNKDWYQATLNGQPFDHARSFQYVKHSPDGFSWGYGGSGPSQLAFGILLEETNDADFALKHYHRFMGEFIARLPDNWSMTSDDFRQFIEERLEDGTEGQVLVKPAATPNKD